MSDKAVDLLQIPQDDFLDSFETCRILVENAEQAHLTYWTLIDVCEEHIRGKKPKSPEKLKKAGMSWANNWNFLKARSKITKVTLENIDLVKSAMRLAIPEFSRTSDLDILEKDEDRGTLAMKISRVFYESLEKESNFNNWINKIEYPSTSFGFAAVIFDGEDDWMGDPTHPRNIAFEDHTEPENIEVFVRYRTLKAQYLWDKWIDAKNVQTRELTENGETDISSTNWSVKGLESVLWKALSDLIKQSEAEAGPKYKEWEDVTNSILSGDRTIQYWIRNTNNVKIAKIFYRELSGSWTEVYIPYHNDWQNDGRSDAETGDEILYKKHHGKKNQDEVITLVKDSSFTEGGHISELRGLAKYAVEDSMRFNRKKNNIEDKLIFSGSPFFEQRNTQQKEAFKITPSQGFTLVKNGFDLLPNQPNFDLNNHLVSIGLDEQHFLRETQHFDASLEGRLTSRPVKDEVVQKSREVQESKSSKNAAKFSDYSKLILQVLKNLGRVSTPDKNDNGYKGYTYFFNEMEYELKKSGYVDKEASREDVKKFIKDLLDNVYSFEIEPVTFDTDAITLAISMAENSFARTRLKRMLLMAQGFPRKEIDRIAPLPEDSFRNMRDERVAAIENDMFWTTSEVVIDAEDDHIDHLNSHFEKSNRTIQAVQQGRVDIVQAFKYLANILSHTNQHLGIMEQDPTLRKQYEELIPIQEGFIKILTKVRAAAEQEQKRRQEEQQNTIPPEKLKELQILEWEKVQKQRRTEELQEHKKNMTIRDQEIKRQKDLRQQDIDAEIERRKVEIDRELGLAAEAVKAFN